MAVCEHLYAEMETTIKKQGKSHNNQIFSGFLLHLEQMSSLFLIVCSGPWVQRRHVLLVMSEQLLADMEFSIKLWNGDSHNNKIFYGYLLDGCIWVLQWKWFAQSYVFKSDVCAYLRIIFSSTLVQNMEQVHLENRCCELMLNFLWMFGNVSWPLWLLQK